MRWKEGQPVVCDRPNRKKTGYIAQTDGESSITIFCPTENIVICGTQACLEKQGWCIDEQAVRAIDVIV